MKKWYQQIAGDGRQTALVTVDESVYQWGYQNQQLENMVFDTYHNLVFERPEPQQVDFEVHFFMNADGELKKKVINMPNVKRVRDLNNTQNQNDMKIINMLFALNHIPVVIKQKNGQYQAYNTRDGHVLVHKNEMMNKGKDLTPLGILGELAMWYRENEAIVLINRMMFKGNRAAAWRILNS